jgi:hypothetical protein
VKLRVIGGTARGDEDLCHTCRSASIRVGLNGAKTVFCNMFQTVWREPTSECNSYDDKRVPRLHEMKEIAWSVEASNRSRAGFRPVPLSIDDQLSKAIDDIENP